MLHPRSMCRLNYVQYLWAQLVFLLMHIDVLMITILKNIAWQCSNLLAFSLS